MSFRILSRISATGGVPHIEFERSPELLGIAIKKDTRDVLRVEDIRKKRADSRNRILEKKAAEEKDDFDADDTI
ncbi:Fc.00g108460.m01.CDS01 [Cosmosporella sp. VM-42]